MVCLLTRTRQEKAKKAGKRRREDDEISEEDHEEGRHHQRAREEEGDMVTSPPDTDLEDNGQHQKEPTITCSFCWDTAQPKISALEVYVCFDSLMFDES